MIFGSTHQFFSIKFWQAEQLHKYPIRFSEKWTGDPQNISWSRSKCTARKDEVRRKSLLLQVISSCLLSRHLPSPMVTDLAMKASTKSLQCQPQPLTLHFVSSSKAFRKASLCFLFHNKSQSHISGTVIGLKPNAALFDCFGCHVSRVWRLPFRCIKASIKLRLPLLIRDTDCTLRVCFQFKFVNYHKWNINFRFKILPL